MDSLLRYAYVWQHCNACGHAYAATLLDTLMEQRMADEWQSPRHGEECGQAASPLLSVVPGELLERLDDAWLAVATAVSSAGLELEAGAPQPAQD